MELLRAEAAADRDVVLVGMLLPQPRFLEVEHIASESAQDLALLAGLCRAKIATCAGSG
jgi:hypothetical protein